MKKILIFILLLLVPINVLGMELINTNSSSVMVYDMTDDVLLYDRNGEQERQIASLTKIATTILAIEKIEGDRTKYDFKQRVTITKPMVSGYQWDASIAGLKVGDIVTYEDLLYGTILPSGADAAQALAISLNGSLSSYVNDMNALAKRIGMNNTKFVNVHGLDKYEKEKPYSTAKDVLTLLKYAMQNETFKNVYTHKYWHMTNGLEVYTTLNIYQQKFKYDVNGIVGSKTGMTDLAGTCIAGYFISNNHFYLVITLGAQYSATAGNHVKDLLNIKSFLNENYNDLLLSEKGSEVKNIKILYGDIDSYPVKTKKNITKYLPKDYNKDDFKVVYEGLEEVSSLNVPKKDKVIGTITYTYKGETLDTEDVFFESEVKFDLGKFIKYNENYIRDFLILLVIILVVTIIIIVILKRLTRKHKKNKKK